MVSHTDRVHGTKLEWMVPVTGIPARVGYRNVVQIHAWRIRVVQHESCSVGVLRFSYGVRSKRGCIISGLRVSAAGLKKVRQKRVSEMATNASAVIGYQRIERVQAQIMRRDA